MLRQTCLAAAASLSTACSRQSNNPAAPVKLRIAVAAVSPTVAPFFIAEEGGYFRAAGMDLEIERNPTVAAFVQMLATGVVDIALPALTPAIVNAQVRQAGVKLVFVREWTSPRCGGAGQIVGRVASFPGGLKSGSELRRKKIAILAAGGAMDFDLELLLQSAGVARNELEILALRPAESMAALQAGKIDGFVSFGFVGDFPENLRGQFAYYNTLAAAYPYQQESYVAFGPRLLGPDRALGVRFLRIWLRATREYVAGKTPQFLDTWAQQNGFDPNMVKSSCRDNISPTGELDQTSLQRYADWAWSRKLVEAPIRAETLIDSSLLAEATAQEGPAR
jgi:ABC-type nitrate/sulfonate/bicarbonate transport system substrate-binding protein